MDDRRVPSHVLFRGLWHLILTYTHHLGLYFSFIYPSLFPHCPQQPLLLGLYSSTRPQELLPGERLLALLLKTGTSV